MMNCLQYLQFAKAIIYSILRMSARWKQTYEDELSKINRFLGNPWRVNRDVATVYRREAISRIEEEMDRLKKTYPFTHQFIKPEHMDNDTLTVRSVRRLIKLRFRCKNQKCEEYKGRISETQKASEVERHWTSYNGVVDFRFYFMYEKNPSKSQRPGTHLVFSFRIFNQKCFSCKEWGKTGLIETIFEELNNLFSLIIQNTLVLQKYNEQVPWGIDEKYGMRERRQGTNNRKSSHLVKLCEACMEGVCLHFFEEKKEEMEVKKEAQRSLREVKKEVKAEDDCGYIVPRIVRAR